MILFLHLAGAAVSVLLSGAGAIAIVRQKVFSGLTVAIPIIVTWQLITGTGLIFQGAGLVRMCLSGGIYVSLMAVLEYRLLQIKRQSAVSIREG